MSNGKKTENIAFVEMAQLCNQTNLIDFSGVKLGEKGISWDGDLMIYASEYAFANGKKEGRERKVPIQLKGKNILNLNFDEYLDFKINSKDLLNYYNNSGCLFLVVAILPTGEKNMYHVIFSKNQISKISSYADGKDHKIKLAKIKDYKHFYEIVDYAYSILNTHQTNQLEVLHYSFSVKNPKPNEVYEFHPSVQNSIDGIYLIIEDEKYIHKFGKK